MYKVLIATTAYKAGSESTAAVSTEVVDFPTPEEAEAAVKNSIGCFYDGPSVYMKTRATFLNPPKK